MALVGMVITPTYICPVPKPFLARPVQLLTVSQENGSLPLVAGIRTTPNIQVTGSVSHTYPAVNSFRNPKPIQSDKAKVSLSTVPTISKASQHNNTIAIPTCSGIMSQEVSFSDSLIAEPVIGTTNLGRSRNSKIDWVPLPHHLLFLQSG